MLMGYWARNWLVVVNEHMNSRSCVERASFKVWCAARCSQEDVWLVIN